ncbi:MAG: hypothetical protein NTY30_01085 [Candidatus Berkelbacteria bacterium]|nr:hypothetical protein [Candidatus Berkelbacteria bacterium]
MVKVDIEYSNLSGRDLEMAENFSSVSQMGGAETSEEDPKESDPKNLLADFEKSKPLKSFIKDRMQSLPAFKGRKRSEIANEEIQQEIEFARETDGYKNLLMKYFQTEGDPLKNLLMRLKIIGHL